MKDKKQYVLCSDYYGVGKLHWDGYYTGNTYIYQGEKYAVCSTDINEAKIYSSFKRAENASQALFETIVNYVFEVKEV
jgi:hypothetical protein